MSAPAFSGMVADDLGPVVGDVDVRLRTQPGQGLRVADERIGGAVLAIAGEVADLECDLAAAGGDVVGAVGAVAGDAEGLRVVAAVVGLGGGVAQMRDAEARFGEELGREDVVVVDAGAVGARDAGRLKAAARRAAQERAEERRLEGVGRLVAEASAEVVLLRDGVVRLDVVADGVFAEGQILREVVGGRSR